MISAGVTGGNQRPLWLVENGVHLKSSNAIRIPDGMWPFGAAGER
jgi:hypothetical protein